MPSPAHTLFISDLHLAAERPQITAQFLRFTTDIAVHAGAIYILGDLFEYWVGDDDRDDPLDITVSGALKALAGQSVPVFMMQGNRDVLMGRTFAQRCGAGLLDDEIVSGLFRNQIELVLEARTAAPFD